MRDEVITPLPDDPDPGSDSRGKTKTKGPIAGPSPSPLWDVGQVVELTPDITKITLSVSELRDKIKNIGANN